MLWLVILFCTRVFLLASSQPRDQNSLCTAQQTCQYCIQTPGCAWCPTTKSAQSTSGSFVRCVSREKYTKHLRAGDVWCPEEDVILSESEMHVIEDRPLSSVKGKDPVQVQPQRISLQLRRGEESRVNMKYTQADDYPVDLYYLMDLSASMEDYRNQLSELGYKLAEAMRKLTSNFRLGFGSFVDKVALPMTNTQPDKLAEPCQLKRTRKPCAMPYGYKNQMPLTEDVKLFKTRVQAAPVSGNLDKPEGGLDAMMQAMVCTKEIGWRQKARHLIVFSTDASFHIAGDGKLAGIVEPNDGLCHLDEEGFYNYSLLQDYPSISQINRKAREHNMNIIFAVPEKVNSTYQQLTGSISGSAIGTIEDFRNIVNLISAEYEKLVESVVLTDTAPKNLDVKYFSRCLNSTGDLIERRECGGLRVGNTIEFDVVLKMVECPANREDWNQTMEIKPRGINESLIIDLKFICDCACERPGNPGYEPNAKACKGNGTLACGVCACNEGFHGKQCECEGNEVNAESAAATSECKPDNHTTEICSGHGTCKCGVCECTKRPNQHDVFYGKYCECDNFSCKRSGGQVCGGRGKCECGICNCFPGWGGETCDCKETNSTCMPSGAENAEICSGRGDCICGSCHCYEKDDIRYSGQYCEECPTCPGQHCDELKDCVECKAYGTGPLKKEDNCNACLEYDVEIVETVEADPEKDEESGARICQTPGDGGCFFKFKYEYHRRGSGGDIKILRIQAEKERSCPKPVDALGVALGVVISTVILGFLILLIWKVLTVIHDRREYAKFEKERALAKWERGDNPLYRQATSTFNNPTFSEHTN